MIEVTLQFASVDEALLHLSKLSSTALPAVIGHIDRPDVGAPLRDIPPLAAPLGDAARVFGGGAVVPPPPPPAPSTAAAAVFSTAATAPTATSPMPPPASPPPAPPSAPAAAAPTAPAAPTSPAGGVELDKNGLPWDQRIHSSNKTKTKDGSWRARSGFNDEALKKRIEAELRASVAANAAVAPPPPPPAAPPAPAAPVVTAAAAAVGLPIAPPPAPPAPPPAAAPAATFADLMVRLGPALADGRLSPEKCAQVLSPFNLTGIHQLATAPNLIPIVAPMFDAAVAA